MYEQILTILTKLQESLDILAESPANTKIRKFFRKADKLQKDIIELAELAKNQRAEVKNELPYASEAFRSKWMQWHSFLFEQHKIVLREAAEKAQLARLEELANDEAEAVKILDYAMFKLKYPFFFRPDELDEEKEKQNDDYNYDKL